MCLALSQNGVKALLEHRLLLRETGPKAQSITVHAQKADAYNKGGWRTKPH